jgi:hypothetical protein
MAASLVNGFIGKIILSCNFIKNPSLLQFNKSLRDSLPVWHGIRQIRITFTQVPFSVKYCHFGADYSK